MRDNPTFGPDFALLDGSVQKSFLKAQYMAVGFEERKLLCQFRYR